MLKNPSLVTCDLQRIFQVLKAYCPNIYIVDLGKNQITQQRPRYQSPTDQSALTNITMCYYLGDDIETRLVFSMKWTHFTAFKI